MLTIKPTFPIEGLELYKLAGDTTTFEFYKEDEVRIELLSEAKAEAGVDIVRDDHVIADTTSAMIVQLSEPSLVSTQTSSEPTALSILATLAAFLLTARGQPSMTFAALTTTTDALAILTKASSSYMNRLKFLYLQIHMALLNWKFRS
ncbi:uncharacterized protein A4U43_C02F21430 [Asparagus officinalis]|uniref:Uncharacterized protein n=1 Tax=Asparagus officinalis TaxID=4686 RepID=A0A5P1FPS5_ASPOF|nr:uncharacterized protein A4U43_C02F21430 [Asparagus officinalis]